jgi:hypothetical protein
MVTKALAEEVRMAVFTFATPIAVSVVPARSNVTIPNPWRIVTSSVTVVPGE